MQRSPVVGLLVPGFSFGGGIPASASFARSALLRHGFKVVMIELATSRYDSNSRRILSPRTWISGARIIKENEPELGYFSGSQLAELEIARYQPRKLLTKLLSKYDVALTVAGFPAWAHVMRDLRIPTALQIASLSSWERGIELASGSLRLNPRRFQNNLVHKLDSSGVRIPDLVLTMNKHLFEWSSATRESSQHVKTVTPGIDIDFYSPSGPWSRKGPLISVGRLGDRRKGWGRLFISYDTAATLDPDIPDLLVVGNGQLSKEDFEILESLDHRRRIQVHSDVDRSQLRFFLRSSSLYIQASYEEGLGLAALEGMACGLPIVSTNSAGPQAYVIPNETGILLQSKSMNFGRELATSIGEIFSEMGHDMSKASRKLCVEKFSQASTSAALANSIQLLL